MPNTYNFLILLWIIPHISCQIWRSPYFVPPPEQELTTLYEAFAGYSQLIYVHEQLAVPFRIAIVNYDGPGTVTLGAFTRGYGTDIDIQIERGTEDDKRFFVTVNKEQDYEKLSEYTYRFEITVIEGSYTQRYFIQISITNLIDTVPTIEYDAPCTIEELLPVGHTDCIFKVSVEDGFEFKNPLVDWENKITAILFEDAELNSLFEFEFNSKTDNYALFDLNLKKILHYEDKPFYNFRSYFQNSEGYSSSILTIVELIDIPNMKPIWTVPFTIKTFNEKEYMYFDVTAIDGDTGIDADIEFRIEFDKDDEKKYGHLIMLTKISKNVARIEVPREGIDRDELKQEILRFTIIAFKMEGAAFETPSSGLIVINDINDQLPEISMLDEYNLEIIDVTLTIPEEKFLTLPIHKIIVDDRDSEENAMYYVKLGHDGDIPYSEPFNIIPGNGYQRSEFFKIDIIQNEGYLDYENETWRSFQIHMIATETANEERYTKKIIKINLLNWNDEIPIFQKDDNGEYFVEVREDIGEGEFILQVLATDRDEGDVVTHSILGSLGDLLYIDPENGRISTTRKNTFDYEKQEQIILQVMAQDVLSTIGEEIHKVYAQVTINITDVNDETPQIKMPATPVIDENVPGDFLVTAEIEAYDPDTTAELKFEIVWADSTATKSGRTVDPIHYLDCFRIKGFTGEDNIVRASLTVNPEFVDPGKKDIDYEKFEVLYLSIKVTDTKQYIGIDNAVAQLTIRIDDVNDNKPTFVNGTELTVRSVLEEALYGTQIGTILAEDLDGPDFNEITYTIIPVNASIPVDWIDIDNKGVIRVKEDKAIDCDEPPRDYLEYYVTIADGEFDTTSKIIINVIDTNNKFPQIPEFENTIFIKENIKNGEPLTTIIATDADRDKAYRELQYLIDPSYDKARNYFEIDRYTGLLTVNLVGAEFDYDEGEKTYDIPIEVYDGVTVVAKRNTTQFQVNLIDVNDNAPVFQEGYRPKIAENSPIGTSLEDLCATDLDSGVNGEISFALLSIKPPGGGEELKLFDIKPKGTNCASLSVISSLEKYYGTWELTITATDHGVDDVDFGAQSTEEKFYVEITPFNFNSPNITSPSSDSIRLIRDQEVGGILRDVNNDPIKAFEAEDNDGGIFGEVEFFVNSRVGQDETDAEFFTFVKINEKKSDLKLTKEIGGKTVYYITCIAVDGGEKSMSRDLNITFVNIDGSPYFEVDDAFAFFKEKEAGQSESYIIPEGKDPQNEGLSEEEEDYLKIYYFLEKTPIAEEYFDLNRETRELKLIKQLNRNEHERHTLKVILSREQENAPSDPADEAILPLTILVTPEGAPTIDPSKPTIFYPVTNTLRLIDDQTINTDLVVVGNSGLRSFEAFGRNYDQSLSDIEFIISNVPGELEDAEYFTFYKVNKTSSNLRLAKDIDHPNPFNIRITARDSTKQESESLNLKIIFIDTDRTPYFDKLNDFIFIHENDTGLGVPYPLPSKAIEPLNEGLEDESDFIPIYYFIDSTYNRDDTSKFNLDSQTGILSLNEMLDREAQETHELKIIVSRESSVSPTSVPVDSILLLTVIVWDINDNPPVFDNVNGAGITTSDRPGKIILPVRANDADLNETITYRILDETFRAFGDGIDAVEPSAFSINSVNNLGNIILNFIPRANMVGHFEFNIEASDNGGKHSDTALVKIYIIAEANRVTFVFHNSVSDFDLDDNTQFMLDLFREEFGYICNIDETVSATNENGVVIDNLTNVKVIFIKDNEAIPAETIQEIASDVVFITQLKSKLAQRRLILQEVPTDSSLTDDTNKAELLQTILIVLSVVLGILCAVLIIAFFIRTRNLRRQLKAMSTVDFGSTSSNLNRREAPTTNVFSVEGSNPVLNNNNLKPVFDNISVHSDESDFTGIHDDPTFQHRRESVNPQLIEEIRRKSINPMVNGKSNVFDSNS